MMRFQLNDRYIRGTVAFEDYGDKARMSYIAGTNLVPVNAQYDIGGKTWRVVLVTRSDFNSQVVNVDMEQVNG